MSWIANLSRIRTYADSVVHHAGQAVVGGAKLLRIGSRNDHSFQQAISRLEELSVSTRGNERILLLRKWLVSLKEAERIDCDLDDVETSHDETDDSSKPTLALYHDLDNGVEPVTFRDVFLQSEALEGLALSMIREAPTVEEVELIVEIFEYCLIGGKETRNEVVRSIQDLGKVFSCYEDEVLMKREELLGFARSSILGLKINAQQARIDVEVGHLKSELSEKEIKIPSAEDQHKPFEEPGDARTQALKEAVAQVRIYSKLQELLVQNKALKNGASEEVHGHKVDKLKILLESLASSTSKAEMRIQDERCQKEEALNFRIAKVSEVSQVEKDLEAQMEVIQRQKEELEAQLEKVNSSLATVNARLRIAQEEREQFDETSTDILQQLEFKEEEVLRSNASCKIEASVASAWISFIESSWRLQNNFTKQREQLINDELAKYSECFVNLSSQILSAYENELSVSIDIFREYVQKLKDGSDDIPSSSVGNEALKSAKNWKMLEEQYHDMESKLGPTFKVVENIRQLRAQSEEYCRKDDENIQRLLDELQKMKDDFDSIERPNLRAETPNSASWKSIIKLGFRETPTKLEPIQEEPDSAKYSECKKNQQLHHPIELKEERDPDEEERAALEAELVKLVKDNAAL